MPQILTIPDLSLLPAATLAAQTIDALLKVTLLLGTAALATMALHRASAAVRHLIWTLALAGALFLPVLSIALPRWQLPIVTFRAPDVPAALVAAPPQDLEPAPATKVLRQRTPDTNSIASEPRAGSLPAPAAAAAVPAPSTSFLSSMSPVMWLLAIWAAGAAIVVGRLLLGLLAVQWMSRRTARVVDAPWLPLAVELASELGITRRLSFVESRSATMPMAWGLWRPSVLMPADAVRWPVERLRIVLLHELAHVKRRDCLTHVVVQLACAAYWFNPLAWIAARRIRTERERACDDLVLAAGTRGPDYAEELLEIARVMRAGRFPSIIAGATLAMAHRTQLEGRLIAILDPKVPRTGVSQVRMIAAVVAATCAVLPLASMQPWSVAEAAPAAIAERPAIETRDAIGAMKAPAAAAEPQRATATPRPQPNTHARPEIADVPAAVAAAVADAVNEATQAIPQDVVQTAVQAATQAAAQSVTQDAVQSAIQAAVQSAVHGVGAVVAQEGRKPADPRTIAALTAALKDSDKEVRETAMHALVRLRDPSVFEPLVQALKDTSADMREQAVHGLSQLRDRRAAEPLLGMLQDPNPSVREAVVHALVQLREPRAVDGLITALKDENPSVREQAAHGLGQFRDPRSVEPLIATLKDQNASVREQAVHALSQLRDKRATTAIAALIKDQNPGVREQAVHALGQLRDASSVDGLVIALRDTNPGVREQAVHALSQIRDPRAVQPFIAALKDENPDVRKQAAWGLGQLRERSAVEALVIAIKDSNAEVRKQVAWALGQLGDARAIDALTDALKDANAEVRRQAAWALGQLIGR